MADVPYRVNYRDALDANRLVEVSESLIDAQLVIDAVIVEVPPAAGRLVAAEDPMLGLDLRVIQPPQTLETAGGLPWCTWEDRSTPSTTGKRRPWRSFAQTRDHHQPAPGATNPRGAVRIGDRFRPHFGSPATDGAC